MFEVRDLVFEAISTSGRGINYTVNIDNKKIENIMSLCMITRQTISMTTL